MNSPFTASEVMKKAQEMSAEEFTAWFNEAKDEFSEQEYSRGQNNMTECYNY